MSSAKAKDGDVVRYPGTPRWVKILGTIASLLLVVFIVLHLTGNTLGGHLHGHGR